LRFLLDDVQSGCTTHQKVHCVGILRGPHPALGPVRMGRPSVEKSGAGLPALANFHKRFIPVLQALFQQQFDLLAQRSTLKPGEVS